MNPTLQTIRDALGRLTARQKLQFVLAFVAALGLVWGFTLYVNRVRYGVLFSNLDRDDAAPIVGALKDLQIAHRISAGGSVIEVPFEQIDDVRLELAGDGLPTGGGVGFELFDKPAFGLSDFVQNVNYRRALERELARTIQSLDVVDSARVHLALPPEAVFADERRHPTASVVVRLRSGRSIATGRVQAISHLVAAGVEGLEPGHVSVIDGEGRMLSGGDGEDAASMSATQVEAQRRMERNIETTLLAMLEPLVGPGKVRARATVDLNMTRVQRVEEQYDPQSAVVRSEDKSKSSNEGSSGGGGVPGATANLPGGQTGGAGGAADKGKSQRTLTNFEISKTVSTISEPVGTMSRQSIAVVVDHAAPSATGGDAVEGDATATAVGPVPRTPEEMQKITDLVRAAIGFDEKRGDQLIVENVPFDEHALPVEEAGGVDVLDLVLRVLRFASLPLAVLMLIFLVFRPAIAAMGSLREPPPALTDGGGPPTVAQLQAQVQAQIAGGVAPSLSGGTSPLREKLIEAVAEDPQTAALVVRNWIEPPKESA